MRNKAIGLGFMLALIAVNLLLCLVVLFLPMAPVAATAKSGLLSQDLLLDDGWTLFVDESGAADKDDVFCEPSMTSDTSKIWLPPGARVNYPKNLDVDLESSQLYSSLDFYDADKSLPWHKLGGSPLFLNASANAGSASDATITATTELGFSNDYGECLATSGTLTADQYVTWKTELEEDRDGDGTLDEAGDEEFLTAFNGDEIFVIHLAAKSDAASSSTDNYAEVTLSFKTNGANNYGVTFRLYEYAGDTDTSVASVSNGAQMDFYSVASSTSYEHIIITFDLSMVIADDNEIAQSAIRGLDYIQSKINIDSESDDKYIGLRIYNIAVYTQYPGVTDRINDAGDYDYDTSGIPDKFDEDCDLPNSEITDNSGTTDDTYDNLLPLEHDILLYDGSPFELKARFRKLKLTSNTNYEVEIEPAELSNTNYGNGGKPNWDADLKGYLVQSRFTYDLTWMDYGGNPTTYFSWTASSDKVMFEWKLDYDQMCYKVTEDSNPAYAIYRDSTTQGGWYFQDTEQTAELIAAWDGQSTNAEITDILLNEPSQSFGAKISGYVRLWMRNPAVAGDVSPVGGGEEEEAEEDGATSFWGLAAMVGSFIVGFFSLGKLQVKARH